MCATGSHQELTDDVTARNIGFCVTQLTIGVIGLTAADGAGLDITICNRYDCGTTVTADTSGATTDRCCRKVTAINIYSGVAAISRAAAFTATDGAVRVDGTSFHSNGRLAAVTGKTVTTANAAKIAIGSFFGQSNVSIIINGDRCGAASAFRTVSATNGVGFYGAAGNINGCTAACIGGAVAAANTVTVSAIGFHIATGNRNGTATTG